MKEGRETPFRTLKKAKQPLNQSRGRTLNNKKEKKKEALAALLLSQLPVKETLPGIKTDSRKTGSVTLLFGSFIFR